MYASLINGPLLVFRPEDEAAIVAAFARHGYRCTPNDGLVRAASGYAF